MNKDQKGALIAASLFMVIILVVLAAGINIIYASEHYWRDGYVRV